MWRQISFRRISQKTGRKNRPKSSSVRRHGNRDCPWCSTFPGKMVARLIRVKLVEIVKWPEKKSFNKILKKWVFTKRGGIQWFCEICLKVFRCFNAFWGLFHWPTPIPPSIHCSTFTPHPQFPTEKFWLRNFSLNVLA